MKRPNLFLMASPRAGSTQLASWLASHPDISLSSIKEPNHFSAHEFDPIYVANSHLNDVDPPTYVRNKNRKQAQFAVFRDRNDYIALFENMQTRWRMEASTSYLSCPRAPELIRQYAPGARIIILTRDPVKRAISHYRLARRTGRVRAALMQELNAEIAGNTPLAARYLLRPSQTQDAINLIKSKFPLSQCLFLKFEEMITEPKQTMHQIADWLGIDESHFDLKINAQNASVAPRFSIINAYMEKTGVKSKLRRKLPSFTKPWLKKIWFNPKQEIQVTCAEIAALTTALEQV
jgi:hypothetical protein